MRLEFDDGMLLLRNAPETVPYAEWDTTALTSITPRPIAYRALLERPGALGQK